MGDLSFHVGSLSGRSDGKDRVGLETKFWQISTQVYSMASVIQMATQRVWCMAA